MKLMKVLRIILSVLIIAVTLVFMMVAFCGGIVFYKYGLPLMTKITYLELKEPLLLTLQGEQTNFHVLPPGTALYKDRSFPDGHTRYIMYLNFGGTFAADRLDSNEPEVAKAQLWARTIPPDDLKILMSKTAISKEDLARILKIKQITKAEMMEIAQEWTD